MMNQEAIKTLRELNLQYEKVYDKAISALQTQNISNTNTEDMVSKKAVELALIEKGWSSKRYKLGEIWELNADEIKEALTTVPPVQVEQQWIPVNKRLPKKDGTYLVSGVWNTGEEQVSECEFYVHEGCFMTLWNFGVKTGFDIKAWMPYPEPYKGK